MPKYNDLTEANHKWLKEQTVPVTTRQHAAFEAGWVAAEDNQSDPDPASRVDALSERLDAAASGISIEAADAVAERERFFALRGDQVLTLKRAALSLSKIADSLEALNNVVAAAMVRVGAAVGAVERACDLASSNPPTVASRVASAAVSSFAKVVMR